MAVEVILPRVDMDMATGKISKWHHKDGDKHNNSPENLEVMTQAEHMRLHHAEMTAARKAKGGYKREA